MSKTAEQLQQVVDIATREDKQEEKKFAIAAEAFLYGLKLGSCISNDNQQQPQTIEEVSNAV